ncbi:hypothetical protein ACFL54_06425 [Planctomycetota bacterium]
MNSNRFKDIEDRLGAKPEGIMPAPRKQRLKQRIYQKLPFETGVASSAGMNNIKLYAILAACVLLLLGLGLLGPGLLNRQDQSEVAGNDIIPAQPATNGFYIVESKAADKSLIVQDFKDFLIIHRQVGSEISGFTIIDVTDDALTLQDGSGFTRESLVVDFNRESIAMLKNETVVVKKRFMARQMDQQDLQRLKNIAYFDGTGAFELLEQVAGSSSDFSREAQIALSGTQELNQVLLAAKCIRSKGQYKARTRAIRALGKTASPLALQHLKKLAVELKNESLALDCVRAVKQYEPVWALGALESIATRSDFESVRAEAAAAAAEITKELRND